MNLNDVISIPGESGLFKMLVRATNAGVVAESIVSKKRVFINPTTNVNVLTNIGIYTTGEEMPLKDIFQKIYERESGGPCISHKQPDAELITYFKLFCPDYDTEKVHTSIIRKVLQWYNLLQESGLMAAEEKVMTEEEKTKQKNQQDFDSKKHTNLKDNNSSVKTSQSKVKAAGVRKTGVA